MRTVILLGLLALTNFATAQDLSDAPDGKVHTRIEGIKIPSVANAPFTAKIVVLWDQPLVGGGTISHKYFTMVARDAQGRVHREVRDFIPADSSAEPPLRSILITDPVTSTRITCTTEGMSCTLADFRAPLARTGLAGAPSTESADGKSRQSLGQQTIDDLPVVGTREITTSTAGTHGSSRVVVTSQDLWYSADLSMYFSVIRKDPQLGQVTLTVTDLTRQSPDPSWFGVPEGFTAIDARSNRSGIR
jgi:hypothetical protein